MPEIDNDDYLWNPRATPDPEIVRLETALRSFRRPDGMSDLPSSAPIAVMKSDATLAVPRRGLRVWRRGAWPVAAIAAALLLVLALDASRRLMRPWAVITMRETAGWLPAVQARRPLTTGEWIVTDTAMRARLNVGSLGRVDIGPSSRVRLVRAAMTEHRLALVEGTLRARIWAPPRFFIVETAAATAVDLGCVYTLQVDRNGVGYLRVESGEVELVGSRLLARVPAGNTVHVNAQTGPGLPFPDQSSSAFVAALTVFEQQPAETVSSTAALAVLLRESTARASITLWHLLPLVDGTRRASVVDRLVDFTPLPAGIDRESVMRLDTEALRAWRTSMEVEWSTERAPLWKRWWRSWWGAASGTLAVSL